ncbi:Uncharacterised protein [Mycobacteroides abscessus subsp. abscessus]|nr:Uncharacterised protein [Mycobacteroides abscessus subsp. abscessus]
MAACLIALFRKIGAGYDPYFAPDTVCIDNLPYIEPLFHLCRSPLANFFNDSIFNDDGFVCGYLIPGVANADLHDSLNFFFLQFTA